MSDEPRRPWIRFLLRSRLGRMILVAGALSGILAALPALCQRTSKAEPLPQPSDPASASGTLPPRPTGFEESLPVAAQFKALVSSYGDRVTGTEKELQATRKELETMKIQLEEARSRARKDAEAPPPRAGSPKENPGQDPKGVSPTVSLPPFAPGHADQRAPEKEGIRLIELSAPTPEPKSIQKSLRIPPATGGQATLLNGVFAPVQGEPAPVRLRLDAALVGPNHSRIPIRDASSSRTRDSWSGWSTSSWAGNTPRNRTSRFWTMCSR